MNLALDDVCEFINGGAWSDDEYAESGIRVVKVTNMENGTIAGAVDYLPITKHEKYKRHELRAYDVIVATVGSHPTQPGSVVGRTARIPPSFGGAFLNQNAACLRVKRADLVDQRFLFYLSRTVLFRHHIESRARGSANQVRMAIGDLRKFSTQYPSLMDQKKIAAALVGYDDLIEANQRRIALLERMAEEIYREWFVRLRFPGHEKIKIVKGVPAGWTNARFGEFCRLKRGYDLPDAEVVDGPYPVIASTSIKAFHAEFKVEPPVITTGRSGSLGEVLMVNQRAWPLNTALYVKEFFGNSPFLIFYTLQNMELEKFNAGAGVPTLNRNHLEGLRLVVPPSSLQTQFDEVIGPLHRQADTLRAANETLTRTRDLLLPRLISGKLRVDELAIAFPPSMAAEAAS